MAETLAISFPCILKYLQNPEWFKTEGTASMFSEFNCLTLGERMVPRNMAEARKTTPSSSGEHF